MNLRQRIMLGHEGGVDAQQQAIAEPPPDGQQLDFVPKLGGEPDVLDADGLPGPRRRPRNIAASITTSAIITTKPRISNVRIISFSQPSQSPATRN